MTAQGDDEPRLRNKDIDDAPQGFLFDSGKVVKKSRKIHLNKQIKNAEEAMVLLRRGIILVQDSASGMFLFHEKGVASLDGRVWPIKKQVADLMIVDGLIERAKKLTTIGGDEWIMSDKGRERYG